MKKLSLILFTALPMMLMACEPYVDDELDAVVSIENYTCDNCSDQELVANHAGKQTTLNTIYDGSWVNIGYPGGDPGYQQGVCTDVIVRALRCIDIDLQELIHNDLKANREYYNKRYRIKAIDNNIDHRRTQNIQSYLTKLGANIKVPLSKKNYKPGDILFWDDIAAGHTGIISNEINPSTGNYYVLHNIGGGAQYEDFLEYYEPSEVYRLTDNHLAKMKKDCTFKYDPSKDFKNHVQ
jgi:uncharacterized protein YijF (DUF1287 family)